MNQEEFAESMRAMRTIAGGELVNREDVIVAAAETLRKTLSEVPGDGESGVDRSTSIFAAASIVIVNQAILSGLERDLLLEGVGESFDRWMDLGAVRCL